MEVKNGFPPIVVTVPFRYSHYPLTWFWEKEYIEMYVVSLWLKSQWSFLWPQTWHESAGLSVYRVTNPSIDHWFFVVFRTHRAWFSATFTEKCHWNQHPGVSIKISLICSCNFFKPPVTNLPPCKVPPWQIRPKNKGRVVNHRCFILLMEEVLNGRSPKQPPGMYKTL